MDAKDRAALEQRIAAALEARTLDAAATLAIRGYGPEICGYLQAVVREEDAARDVFSMFAEDLWRGIAGFRQECSFRTWAYKLAWHAAARHFGDPYRARKRRLATSEAAALAVEVRSQSRPWQRSSAQSRVATLRAGLAPDEQTLLTLRIDRKLSWREVAHVLSEDATATEEAALRKRFERIKARLRDLAVREGLL